MAKSGGGGGSKGGSRAAYGPKIVNRIRRYAQGRGVSFSTKKTKKGSGTLFILTVRNRRYTTTSQSQAIEIINKYGRDF